MTCWYLTGLLAALGFSFGFYLVKPAGGVANQDREFLDAFTSQDGEWYKQIATEGYRYDPNTRSNVAFFPVFPLLGRAVMEVTGLPPEAALLAVSNLSLLAALAMLGLYTRARYPDAPGDLAACVVLAAALFPTGCFFRLAYSESTFLLLLLVAMYAMLRRWPLWSIALLVGLTTGARAVGVALLPPFAIHIFRRASAARHGGSPAAHRSIARFLRDRVAPSLVYLPLACWGLLAFSACQSYAFGDPFAVFKAHGNWRILPVISWQEKALALLTLEPIASVYENPSPAFWASQDSQSIPWFSLQFANPLFFLAGVALVATGAWRRWLSFEEASLAALMLLIPYTTRAYEMGMGSMGRFVAAVFPAHVVLGQALARLPASLGAALLAISAFFLATYAALYGAGYFIF
ncbi:MAG TPA: hypothetical protein VNH11_13050 [Pirellulales bacterium]|nr:hypothetical protein [Pirellulales bacterium]